MANKKALTRKTIARIVSEEKTKIEEAIAARRKEKLFEMKLEKDLDNFEKLSKLEEALIKKLKALREAKSELKKHLLERI